MFLQDCSEKLLGFWICIFLKTKEVSEKYTVPVKKAPISQKSPRIPGVFSPQSHLQNRGLTQKGSWVEMGFQLISNFQSYRKAYFSPLIGRYPVQKTTKRMLYCAVFEKFVMFFSIFTKIKLEVHLICNKKFHLGFHFNFPDPRTG